MRLLSCRLCQDAGLTMVLDFGILAQGGLFPKVGQEAPKLPLRLVRCDGCGLVQLGDDLDPSQLYGSHYGYRSGLNTSMVEHLADIVRLEVPRWVGELGPGDAVLDIGSNDGTLLNYYPADVRRVGIDPSISHLRQFYRPGIEAIEGFFGATHFHGAFKVITSIAMFYDVRDPVDIARQVAARLTPDGVWILEQGYWPGCAREGIYDVICHEHLLYYSVETLAQILRLAGLTIRAVSFNQMNGGSFRVIAGFRGEPVDLDPLIAQERDVNLVHFATRVQAHGTELRHWLEYLKSQGRSVLGYGASTKGNTVLQHAGITPALLPAIVDVSEAKRGCWTPGTQIPIVLSAPAPDYYLVLPWHFRPSILRRERAFLEGGGRFIFPLPEIETVGSWEVRHGE